jgi:hypothetical protein
MIRKVIDGLAVASFLLSAGLAGGAYFGFKYVKSPQFKTKIKNVLLGDVTKALPSAIGVQLPKSTGPGIPFK